MPKTTISRKVQELEAVLGAPDKGTCEVERHRCFSSRRPVAAGESWRSLLRCAPRGRRAGRCAKIGSRRRSQSGTPLFQQWPDVSKRLCWERGTKRGTPVPLMAFGPVSMRRAALESRAPSK
ncbi:MAG: hypothetical protein ACHQPH_03270 [Reyranellales bacterium]